MEFFELIGLGIVVWMGISDIFEKCCLGGVSFFLLMWYVIVLF